VDVLQFSRFP